VNEISKKGSGPTVPVTIRLTEEQAKLFQKKADAAFVSRSAYIASRLAGEEPAHYPALAALARMIAIHETARARAGLTGDQLVELRAILGAFARLARTEALR
jgi:hypothetical protein